MIFFDTENWVPADLGTLLIDVVDAVEHGEIDLAFDNLELSVGNLSRAKNTRDYTKNYLAACIRSGINGISEAKYDTALGLLNAFRRMSSEPPLDKLPDGVKVFAIKLPDASGKPNVEIYIKDGGRVLYGEKIIPRGILTDNFLSLTGSALF